MYIHVRDVICTHDSYCCNEVVSRPDNYNNLVTSNSDNNILMYRHAHQQLEGQRGWVVEEGTWFVEVKGSHLVSWSTACREDTHHHFLHQNEYV